MSIRILVCQLFILIKVSVAVFFFSFQLHIQPVVVDWAAVMLVRCTPRVAAMRIGYRLDVARRPFHRRDHGAPRRSLRQPGDGECVRCGRTGTIQLDGQSCRTEPAGVGREREAEGGWKRWMCDGNEATTTTKRRHYRAAAAAASEGCYTPINAGPGSGLLFSTVWWERTVVDGLLWLAFRHSMS